MTKKNLILSFIVLLSYNLVAQQFTFVDGGMVSVGRSSVAWGDYDNDGDLDDLITGDHGSGPYVASIYRNDAGEFANINAGLTGIYNSAVAWGDYDNDGDLDILACGRNSSNSKTYIYQNNNGTFLQKEAGLPVIGSDGAVAWGDYDGDADLDILIAGAYSCRVYTNNFGVFTNANLGLPAVSNCWVDWGDFDNDGDLDIFVMGDLGGILVSSIYRNDKGAFTEMPQTSITPLAGGSSAWCDFDHDRDLDLLITGFNEYLEPQTTIFSNLGNMEFMDVFPGLIGASLGTAAWGDYDNDGETDILLTGQNAGCGILSSMVYHNDGNTIFTDINAPLEGAERGSAAWGDFDNDGDLDLLISGITGAGSPATRLYSNTNGSNVFSANQPPLAPDGLSMYIDSHTVTLGWNPSSDDHTPTNGLTYNLRIGTSSGAQDILTAMSNPLNGKLLLPKPGNTGNNSDWTINLPDGTYFWSVQAIDHSFAASEFSEEQTFTILNVGKQENEYLDINIFPNPVSDILKITASEEFDGEIIGLDGKVLKTESSEKNTIAFDLSDCIPGIYILKMNYHPQIVFRKIIKM
jgi:uncharacterized membrane protein YeaQ/YmgE (transglycosylase-associated protein family)